MDLTFDQQYGDLLWEHGTMLGYPGSIEYDDSLVLDPESFLLEASYYARDDYRFFRETAYWFARFHERLDKTRLKSHLSSYDDPTGQKIFAGILDHMKDDTGSYQGYKTIRSRLDTEGETVQVGEEPRTPDPVFQSNNVTVTSPFDDESFQDVRDGYPPQAAIQRNPRLRFRTLFGANARAEIVTFLQTGGTGNPNALEDVLKYAQPTLRDILQSMQDGGFVRRTDGHSHEYSARSDWDLLDRSEPSFVNWTPVYRSLRNVRNQYRGKFQDLSEYQGSVIQEELHESYRDATQKALDHTPGITDLPSTGQTIGRWVHPNHDPPFLTDESNDPRMTPGTDSISP